MRKTNLVRVACIDTNTSSSSSITILVVQPGRIRFVFDHDELSTGATFFLVFNSQHEIISIKIFSHSNQSNQIHLIKTRKLRSVHHPLERQNITLGINKKK